MRSPHVFAALSVVSSLVSPAFAAGDLWSQDFEAAKKRAAAEHKDLLVDFTGSDWCGWCIRLQKEVFTTDAFVKAAPEKFVLVELDFPQGKTLPAETKAQNEKLQKEYGIQGFPTLLLLDASGRPFARTGYREGGPEAYLKHLEELAAVRQARDKNWELAAAAQGAEKARFLAAGLKTLDEDLVAQFYKPVVEEIRGLDPEDKTGTGAAFSFKADAAAFGEGLAALAAKGDSSVFLPEADKFLAGKPNATPKQRQQVYMGLLRYYRPPNDLETVLQLLRKVEALAPDTEEAKNAAQIAKRVEDMIARRAAAPGGK